VIAAERDRMARELHDTVGQTLYGIALGVRTARELLPADPQRAGQALDYVLELIQRSQAELRALILGLRPNALDTDGLVVALLMQAGAPRGIARGLRPVVHGSSRDIG
jgi:signal transduction histidine kinase